MFFNSFTACKTVAKIAASYILTITHFQLEDKKIKDIAVITMRYYGSFGCSGQLCACLHYTLKSF